MSDTFENVDQEIVSEAAQDGNTAVVTNKEKRKYFAKTGWRIALVGLIIQLFEFALVIPIQLINHGQFYLKNTWIQYPVIFICVNCIGFPLAYLLFKKVEKTEIEKKKLKFGWLIVLLFISFGITMVGNFLGMAVNAVILLPFGINPTAGNALTNLMGSSNPINIILGIIVAGIGAPIFEELIFRKLLIDHSLKYGAGASILLSGLFFGLYHGNFGQFFYAFILGVIFSYVYINTGNIKNTIMLHMGINLYSTAILIPSMSLIKPDFIEKLGAAVQLMQQGDFQAYLDAAVPLVTNDPGSLIGIYLMAAAVIFEYSMIFAGFILALCFIKRFININKAMPHGTKGTKRAAVFNWGSLLMVGLCSAIFLYFYLSQIIPVLIMRFAK